MSRSLIISCCINEGMRAKGNYVTTFDGSELPSGMYLYRLNEENFIQTKKLVLAK